MRQAGIIPGVLSRQPTSALSAASADLTVMQSRSASTNWPWRTMKSQLPLQAQALRSAPERLADLSRTSRAEKAGNLRLHEAELFRALDAAMALGGAAVADPTIYCPPARLCDGRVQPGLDGGDSGAVALDRHHIHLCLPRFPQGTGACSQPRIPSGAVRSCETISCCGLPALPGRVHRDAVEIVRPYRVHIQDAIQKGKLTVHAIKTRILDYRSRIPSRRDAGEGSFRLRVSLR